jgi:murein L,D-transpeptidase YcbB/YkuD
VVIFYTTAIADRDGRVYFLPDVYGHDAKLRRALAGTAELAARAAR